MHQIKSVLTKMNRRDWESLLFLFRSHLDPQKWWTNEEDRMGEWRRWERASPLCFCGRRQGRRRWGRGSWGGPTSWPPRAYNGSTPTARDFGGRVALPTAGCPGVRVDNRKRQPFGKVDVDKWAIAGADGGSMFKPISMIPDGRKNGQFTKTFATGIRSH